MTAVQPRVATLPLRYGLNPHQGTASATAVHGRLPFRVRNGAPSYLNLLDALTAWQLVRDGRTVLRRPVAASFKHTSPNGVGTDVPLSAEESAAYQAPPDLSPIALAYVRARGTDRVAAYGDFIALSDAADESFAQAVRGEVTSGVLAPAFHPAALRALSRKRGGELLVLEFDPDAEPPALERRETFGVQLCQERDSAPVTREALGRPVTRATDLPPTAVDDLLVACLAVRYAQSNAICLAQRGQTVGIGTGQPSRVQATRLACQRADAWLLRQHPTVRNLRYADTLTRHDRDTAADEFVRWDELPPPARHRLIRQSARWLGPLTERERAAWLGRRSGVALASDGPFPFADSVYAAAGHGVRYVAHPGGSAHDADVIACADEHDLTMVTFGRRLFRH